MNNTSMIWVNLTSAPPVTKLTDAEVIKNYCSDYGMKNLIYFVVILIALALKLYFFRKAKNDPAWQTAYRATDDFIDTLIIIYAVSLVLLSFFG